MRLHPFLIFISTVIAHSGWSIPAGQPDGVYSVYVAPDGTATYTFLAPITNETYISRGPDLPIPNTVTDSVKFRLKQRGLGGQVACGGYALNHADTDNANNALDAQ